MITTIEYPFLPETYQKVLNSQSGVVNLRPLFERLERTDSQGEQLKIAVQIIKASKYGTTEKKVRAFVRAHTPTQKPRVFIAGQEIYVVNVAKGESTQQAVAHFFQKVVDKNVPFEKSKNTECQAATPFVSPTKHEIPPPRSKRARKWLKLFGVASASKRSAQLKDLENTQAFLKRLQREESKRQRYHAKRIGYVTVP